MFIGDILEKLNEFENDKIIKISDGKYLINEFGSDRGNYCDMYVGTTSNVDHKEIIKTVMDFKMLLERALEVGTMIGYKGGDYDIDECTDVTLGQYGCSGDSISDIRLIDNTVYVVYEVIIRQEVWA